MALSPGWRSTCDRTRIYRERVTLTEPGRPDNARRRVRSPETFGAVAHFRVQVFQAHRASPSEPLPNVTSQARPDSHGLSRRERAPTRRPATPTAPSFPEDGTSDVPCQLMHTSCASFRHVAPPRAAMPPRTVLAAAEGQQAVCVSPPLAWSVEAADDVISLSHPRHPAVCRVDVRVLLAPNGELMCSGIAFSKHRVRVHGAMQPRAAVDNVEMLRAQGRRVKGRGDGREGAGGEAGGELACAEGRGGREGRSRARGRWEREGHRVRRTCELNCCRKPCSTSDGPTGGTCPAAGIWLPGRWPAAARGGGLVESIAVVT